VVHRASAQSLCSITHYRHNEISGGMATIPGMFWDASIPKSFASHDLAQFSRSVCADTDVVRTAAFAHDLKLTVRFHVMAAAQEQARPGEASGMS